MFRRLTIAILLIAFAGCTREADLLRLPGLVANKKTKRIVIEGKATGIGKREIVEFFLIHETSGHDYEAIALSKALPSDIHKALLFIGMEPGEAPNSGKNRFWPKGERVFMTFNSHRIEKLISHSEADETLPETGMVFTGGFEVEPPDQPGTKVYVADGRDPKSISASYNEYQSVLDVPRSAPQGSVYKRQLGNEEYIFEKGAAIEIVIEPEYKDGKKRVLDILLETSIKKPVTDTSSLKDLDFTFLGKQLNLEGILEEFVGIVKAGQDPFVSIEFADDIPLRVIRDLCILLSSIENENGIRIEPPVADHLYFKGYIPGDAFLQREQRVSQPWELRLKQTNGALTGSLTYITQKWRNDKAIPDLEIADYPVNSPEELRARMDEMKTDVPVMLIYTESTVPHGQLMDFIKSARTTHPIVHIFLDKDNIPPTP